MSKWKEKYIAIFKKFGFLGVMFFLIKGLVWLFFGGAIARFVMDLVDKA